MTAILLTVLLLFKVRGKIHETLEIATNNVFMICLTKAIFSNFFVFIIMMETATFGASER